MLEVGFTNTVVILNQLQPAVKRDRNKVRRTIILFQNSQEGTDMDYLHTLQYNLSDAQTAKIETSKSN